MRAKLSVIVLCSAFSLALAGCPEGGINTNDNDAGPPQRDSNVDADTDADVNPCGDDVCDEAGGEDCDNCPQDCLGIACSPVVDLTVQEYRDDHMNEVGETNIDLRSLSECLSARIPGRTECPEDISSWWDGTSITNMNYLSTATASLNNPVIFYGRDASEDASVLALGEAAYAEGFRFVFRIPGGIEAWRAEGWFQDISYEGIVPQYYPPGANVYLIDTMDATSFDDCHIQDATLLDAHDLIYDGQLVNGGQALLDLAPNLTDVLIFFCVNQACVASEEASIAAETLGYTTVYHYKDGTESWYCDSHPTVGSQCGTIVCGP